LSRDDQGAAFPLNSLILEGKTSLLCDSFREARLCQLLNKEKGIDIFSLAWQLGLDHVTLALPIRYSHQNIILSDSEIQIQSSSIKKH
jgi:hypothetical protein